MPGNIFPCRARAWPSDSDCAASLRLTRDHRRACHRPALGGMSKEASICSGDIQTGPRRDHLRTSAQSSTPRSRQNRRERANRPDIRASQFIGAVFSSAPTITLTSTLPSSPQDESSPPLACCSTGVRRSGPVPGKGLPWRHGPAPLGGRRSRACSIGWLRGCCRGLRYVAKLCSCSTRTREQHP